MRIKSNKIQQGKRLQQGQHTNTFLKVIFRVTLYTFTNLNIYFNCLYLLSSMYILPNNLYCSKYYKYVMLQNDKWRYFICMGYSKPGEATDYNTIRRMHFVYWITKTTGTHSEYVITCCFSTETRRRLNVRFIRTLPVTIRVIIVGTNSKWITGQTTVQITMLSE